MMKESVPKLFFREIDYNKKTTALIYFRFIRSSVLKAFLELVLVIYSIEAQIGQTIKGTEMKSLMIGQSGKRFHFTELSDSIAEYDLLSIAIQSAGKLCV